MNTTIRSSLAHGITLIALACVMGCAGTNMGGSGTSTLESSETSLSAESRAALGQLTAQMPAAAKLSKKAKGILVFPSVVKGGFVVGGYHGDGTLLRKGRVAGHYKTFGASYGLQAGLQRYGYALFFMSEKAMTYVDTTSGWEIGVGPSVVIVDEGVARTLTTTTARGDVYAFVFDQTGLMAGLGLQGSKITRID